MDNKSLARGGWWFAAPFALVFAAFLVWPIISGLYMSFTNSSLTGQHEDFAGLQNYAEAFADPIVIKAFLNTLTFTVLSVVPLIVLPFIFAFLVFSGVAGQWLWRLSFFAPYLLPVTAVTGLWGWMYQSQYGLLNGILNACGLEGLDWLNDEKIAMWSVVLMTVWWTLGFNFLLYLSALQGIPESLYEAASIDGAGAGRRLFSITIPLMGKTTVLIVLLQVLSSLKVFEQVYLLTSGGPANSTRTIIQYIYDTGFSNYRLGYASAISYLFFAVIIIVSIAQVIITRQRSAS